jgi:hypothetical protein
MKQFQSPLRPTVRSVLLGGIAFLLFLVSFLHQISFAESNPATVNGSPKEMSSSAVLPGPVSTNGPCKNAPMHCSSLCDEHLSAQAQASELDKSSQKARKEADKAAKKAASAEKKVNKKLGKKDSSTNASNSGAANPEGKPIWKLAGAIPRLFVSHEARTRANEEEKQANKSGVNSSPGYVSQEPWALLLMAAKTAEETQKVAADAKAKADQARAYADSLRQSYKRCLSEGASQSNSR